MILKPKVPYNIIGNQKNDRSIAICLQLIPHYFTQFQGTITRIMVMKELFEAPRNLNPDTKIKSL